MTMTNDERAALRVPKPRPTGENLAEHFARLTERIAQLETQIRDLMDQNALLRQEIDFVTEREREGRQA